MMMVVGFEIDHASGKLDLSKVESIAFPAATAAGSHGESDFRSVRV
jgi:hypothetical protein